MATAQQGLRRAGERLRLPEWSSLARWEGAGPVVGASVRLTELRGSSRDGQPCSHCSRAATPAILIEYRLEQPQPEATR